SLLQERIDFSNGQRNLAMAQIPRPTSRSLALTRIQGEQPDPAVEASLKELLTNVEQQTRDLKPDEASKAREKLAYVFLEKWKAKPAFDLAWAVFSNLAAEVNPTPEKVRFLAHLLEVRQPKPQYLETNFLQQLSALTQELPSNAWPAQTIRRALGVVQKAGQTMYRPRALTWVRPQLDLAMQRFYDGEVLLFARGYAPLAAADELLAKAADDFDLVLSFEDGVAEGFRTR